MKKFFLIVALVLAVVSSLVAGTMAAYTQTLDISSTDLISKSFSITKGSSNNFTSDIKLAPGDDVTYQVTLTNAGEVATTVHLSAALNAAAGKTANNRLGLTYSETGTAGSYASTAPADFSLAPGASKTLYFRVAWPYATDASSNAADNAVMGSSFGSVFSASFNCTSVNTSTHN